MAVSFGMLGILVMLDVCFIVNYFVIRALRKWTDEDQKYKQQLTQRSQKRNSTQDENRALDRENESTTLYFEEFGLASRERDMAFAWFLGSVRLEPLRVQKFKGWKALPGNTGLWTTCVLIVMGSILLSSKLLVQDMGVSLGTLDSDLCVFEDYDEGLQELVEKLENMTHLAEAQEQHRLMVDYYEALLNDTALYGVPPYNCPDRGDVSGLKERWDEPGSFFPGYCGQALEAAIEAAKKRECTQSFCDCPTLPDSAVFRATGLADKKYCGEVCIDVPFPCPQHSAEKAAEVLHDYRYQQYETAEKRRVQKQNDYQFPTSVPEIIQSTATETIDKMMRQVEIASYAYIAYSCAALFFPTPLHLFRAPYWVSVKQFFFGAEKPLFVIGVLASWYAVEYFQQVWQSPDIRLYLHNLRVGDPCFVNVEYLLDRQRVLNEYCEALVPLEPEWNSSASTAIDVLTEVQHFSEDCECPFPNEHVAQWKENVAKTNMTGFFSKNICGSNKDIFDNDCTLMVPNEDVLYFRGNSSICTNKTAARRLILEAPAPEHGDRDWYDLWIASAFLATLIVKVAVANFGIALMELADPFVVCAGEYLGLPVASSSNDKLWSAILASKRRSLFIRGLSRSFFWGFIMHVCLFNMFAAVYEGVGPDTTLEMALGERDKNVLTGCLVFSAAVGLAGTYGIQRLRESTKELHRTGNRKESELEATDEDEVLVDTDNMQESQNVDIKQ